MRLSTALLAVTLFCSALLVGYAWGDPTDAVPDDASAQVVDAGTVSDAAPAAPAATAPDPETDLGGTLSAVVSLLKAGAYWSALGAIMVLLAYALRWFGRYWAWLKTKHGGITLALVCGLLVALGNHLVSHGSFSFEAAVRDAGLTTAMGVMLRNFVIKWFEPAAPATT